MTKLGTDSFCPFLWHTSKSCAVRAWEVHTADRSLHQQQKYCLSRMYRTQSAVTKTRTFARHTHKNEHLRTIDTQSNCACRGDIQDTRPALFPIMQVGRRAASRPEQKLPSSLPERGGNPTPLPLPLPLPPTPHFLDNLHGRPPLSAG